MKKIILCLIIFTNCSNKNYITKNLDRLELLTGKDIKHWNIQPNSEGYIKEDSWIFRRNGTFSYFDYLEYKKVKYYNIEMDF